MTSNARDLTHANAVAKAVARLTPALIAEYDAETDKMVWVLDTFFPDLTVDRAESLILAVEDAIEASRE
jgi:hypothetical protein